MIDHRTASTENNLFAECLGDPPQTRVTMPVTSQAHCCEQLLFSLPALSLLLGASCVHTLIRRPSVRASIDNILR